MEKVGWIFTQSNKERDYIMNSEEICQMAAWQDEVGEHCVTGVVSLSMSDEGSDVHFEAFQVGRDGSSNKLACCSACLFEQLNHVDFPAMCTWLHMHSLCNCCLK